MFSREVIGMNNPICVEDKDAIIQISYQDMLKYHGRTYIAGVTMAYKLLELALGRLVGQEIASRDKISVLLGVYGPGIIDGIEMVTRAGTKGRLTVDQRIACEKDAPDAADGQGGKYYFEVTYHGKTICLALKHDLIPPEFIELSYKVHAGKITSKEVLRLQQMKEEIALLLLACDSAELFTAFGVDDAKIK